MGDGFPYWPEYWPLPDELEHPREVVFPGAFVRWDPEAFTSNPYITMLSPTEVGLLVQATMAAILRGDFDRIAVFPWIVGCYAGSSDSRGRIPDRVRADVLSSGRCLACGSRDDLQVDHVVPVSRGGTDRRANLRPLCGACNRDKGNRLDEEWEGARWLR